MRTVFDIYKRDLKKIFTNWAAVIVLLTLCVLPSLYAWFNIKACWDPYAPEATKNITVAIVNEDQGTDLNGANVNFGNKTVEELKNNQSLGWVFTTRAEADEMLKNEKVFAEVIFPSNFSQDITSILTNDIHPSQLQYIVNEKMNAIAPKITSKGATAIQQNISSVIVSNVSQAIFNTADQVGLKIKEAMPAIEEAFNSVVSLQSKFGTLNKMIREGNAASGQIEQLLLEIKQELPNVEGALGDANQLSEAIKNFVTTSQQQVNNITPTITSDLQIIAQIAGDFSTAIQSIIDTINQGAELAPEQINNLYNKVVNMQGMVKSLISFLKTMNMIKPSPNVTALIRQLEQFNKDITSLVNLLSEIKNAVDGGYKPDLSKLQELQKLATSVGTTASNIKEFCENTALPEINDILNQTYNVANQAIGIIEKAQSQIPTIYSIVNTGISMAQSGQDVTGYLQSKLPELEAFVSGAVDSIDLNNNDKNLNAILDFITSNAVARADFLAHPVTLDEQSIYAMGNYGSAMTPFYTVLCLWVGCLLLVSMLKVNATGKYKGWQNYLGKLLLFLSIAIMQALIVSVGDIFVLKVQMTNPPLFVAGMIFSSLCFTIIVYTLVSVFGNIGKVISIIMLVLQVAASGGTYPVQLMSGFFQGIHPFLPFTYAISIGREAIGGVVNSILYRDIFILIIYTLVLFLTGLLLKPFVNKLIKPFNEKFEEADIAVE